MNQNVGYCPQFDALDSRLTGEEMLYCYARLIGIPGNDIPEVISKYTTYCYILTENYCQFFKLKFTHWFLWLLLVIIACWLLQVCDAALQRFELEQYADKTVKTYSGGTKRKLSVALALLGEPDLILLVKLKKIALIGYIDKNLVWNLVRNYIRKPQFICSYWRMNLQLVWIQPPDGWCGTTYSQLSRIIDLFYSRPTGMTNWIAQ